MEFLIIVDAQNDFITDRLAVPCAKEVVKNICHELEQSSAFPIVTQDIHDHGEYALSVEGKKLPEHCNRSNTGCWLHDELFNVLKCKVGCEYYTVRKSTFAYMNWPTIFSEILQFFPDPELGASSAAITGVTLMGFCTDICVLSNAIVLRSLFPNIPIRVKADCCAGSTPELHEAALKIMAANLIDII